jgi:hypothetical protein
MKNSRLIMFALGFISYLAASLIIMSYENVKNHTTINHLIFEEFNLTYFNKTKFKNYTILPNHQLKGWSYAESVKLFQQLQEVEKTLSLKDWIAEGGMTADVPEVFASFRHFYDPTMPAGKRYMHDIPCGPLMSLAGYLHGLVEIDHVEWAIYGDKSLSKEDPYNHEFCWENGKEMMKDAFEIDNEEIRIELAAGAWRALGETLHMIADNGCPSHVRDDAHPAPAGYSKYFGDPDPYEELVFEKFSGSLASFAKGPADPNLASTISGKKKIFDVAHELAVHTNKNYFTNQTISGQTFLGKDITPIAHPYYVYDSPKLDKIEYDPDYYFYYNNVGGRTVKQCTEVSYIFTKLKLGSFRGYPHLDASCVESQAKALLPDIMVAGKKTIELFIPHIVIEISNADKSQISGLVRHITDDEYKDEIKYNGAVKIIRIDDKYKKLGESVVTANNGAFEGAISAGEGERVYAEISVGGIVIKSEPFAIVKPDEFAFDRVKVFVEFEYPKYLYNDLEYYGHEICSYQGSKDADQAFFPGQQGARYGGTFSKGVFSGKYVEPFSKKHKGNVSIILKDDLSSVVSVTANYDDGITDMNDFIVVMSNVELMNIPVLTKDPTYMYEYRIDGSAAQACLKSVSLKLKCKNQDKIYDLKSQTVKVKRIIVRFE